MRKILMTSVCVFAFASSAFANSDEFTPKKSDLTSLRAAERWCARHPDAMESGDEDEHLISLRECALKIWPPIKDVDADHVDDPKLAAISCGWVVKANRVRGADDAKTNKGVDYLEAFRDGGKLPDKYFWSGCTMYEYVVAECRAHPRASVLDTVNSLISKAKAGKELPSIPRCGA